MQSLLDHCRSFEPRAFALGALLLRNGEVSGQSFMVAEGTVGVYRGDVEFTLVTEPGAGSVRCRSCSRDPTPPASVP
jgi:hypothetical protein